MSWLLARASARALLHHPWQLALALLGIALGVGMVSAVQLTQQSARQALNYAQQTLAGETTDRIEPVRGRLDEETYVRLRQTLPDLPATPVLRGPIALPPPAGPGFLQVLGVDPLSGLGGRALAERAPDIDLGRLIGQPWTVLLDAATARRLGLAPGATLTLQQGDIRREVTLIGIFPAAAGLKDTLLMDLATAQELLELPGRLSSIELRLPAGDAAVRHAIRQRLPADARLRAVEAQLAAAHDMTRAFNLNLTALSLLALLVGMFLIYNTEAFLILQRQRQFAQLRALGVTGRELLTLLLTEAALLGALGSALGLLLGEAIARGLLGLVARTINDLYYRASITEVVRAPGILLAVWALGVLATVAAATPPVLEAIQQSVRRSLSAAAGADAAGRGRALSTLALAAAALALLLLSWSTRNLWSGFAILFLTLTSGCLLLPGFLAWVAGRLAALVPVTQRPPLALGFRTVSRHGRRQGLAAAALMAASATAIAMTMMIGSFRQSVDEWLAQLLRADVYVNQIEKDATGERVLEGVKQQLDKLPGVTATSSVSRIPQTLGDGQDVHLMVYELPARARAGFRLLQGDADGLWRAWDAEDVVMVSEPWAWRHQIAPGARVTLAGPAGPVSLTVAAVYRDYASERGNLAMSRRTYLRHFPPPPLDGLGVYRDDATTPADFESRIRLALANRPVQTVSNAEVRRQSMAIFDRTFAVTEILRVVALGVAVIGIVSALLAQQFERLREYGVLRALGFSGAAIAETVLSQTLLLGLVAATCALPLGLALALVLVEVINLRSFGWTMSLSLPIAELATTWALGVLAALLAGVWPAVRAVRAAPAIVMREE